MKFCVDCKHFVPSPNVPDDPEFARCAKRVDPVTAAPTGFCSINRTQSLGDCGPDAKLFEPRGIRWSAPPKPKGFFRRLLG